LCEYKKNIFLYYYIICSFNKKNKKNKTII